MVLVAQRPFTCPLGNTRKRGWFCLAGRKLASNKIVKGIRYPLIARLSFCQLNRRVSSDNWTKSHCRIGVKREEAFLYQCRCGRTRGPLNLKIRVNGHSLCLVSRAGRK